jgi:hypothetical protein
MSVSNSTAFQIRERVSNDGCGSNSEKLKVRTTLPLCPPKAEIRYCGAHAMGGEGAVRPCNPASRYAGQHGATGIEVIRIAPASTVSSQHRIGDSVVKHNLPFWAFTLNADRLRRSCLAFAALRLGPCPATYSALRAGDSRCLRQLAFGHKVTARLRGTQIIGVH